MYSSDAQIAVSSCNLECLSIVQIIIYYQISITLVYSLKLWSYTVLRHAYIVLVEVHYFSFRFDSRFNGEIDGDVKIIICAL